MPTYYATGVTATLSTCALNPTLSHEIYLQQGATSQADATRVQNALSAAETLPERPVCINAAEKSVIQFIGANQDMPLYMVEAGNAVHGSPRSLDTDFVVQDKVDNLVGVTTGLWNSDSSDSPLTSLGSSPVQPPGYFGSCFRVSPAPSLSHTLPRSTLKAGSSTQVEELAATNQFQRSGGKALVLEVSFSQKSFLLDIPRPRIRGRGFSKGLKIEVFVNGQLAEVSFINAAADRRRAPRLLGTEAMCFAGSRIHRQVEKPWIYYSDAEEPTHGAENTQDMWAAVRAAHIREADIRGRNESGDAPPSADFLRALAELDTPKSLQTSHRLGLIDVVITAGEGRKNGPDTPYILRPTRLEDRAYRKQDTTFQSQPVGQSHKSQTEDYTMTPNGPTLASMQNTECTTPSPRRTIDFTKDLGVDIDPKKTWVRRYENAHGTASKSPRTLLQRLGDLKKMNEKNQDAALQSLKEELRVKELAAKRKKVDEKIDIDLESFLAADAKENGVETMIDGAVLLVAGGTKPPIAMDRQAASKLQSGTVMNIDSAALRSETSIPALQTPRRFTTASSLAHSPTSFAVKLPKARGIQATTSKRKKSGKDGTQAIRLDGADEGKLESEGNTTAAALQSGSKNASKRDKKEDTAGEALSSFEVPEACKRSCIGYDANVNVVRQIGKARSGEFREHSLLVGMRFVVG